jgi:hypothetical protein
LAARITSAAAETRSGDGPVRKAGNSAVLGLGPEVEVAGLLLHVVGQADMGGAWPSGRRRSEGRPEDVWDLTDVVKHRVPLGQRAEQRLLVQFGQRIAAARGHRYVRGDRQHGDRALVGLDHAGQDVGRAAAAGALADPDPARQARIGVGHIGGAAFVAGQDVVDAVIQPVQSVVERQAGVAT